MPKSTERCPSRCVCVKIHTRARRLKFLCLDMLCVAQIRRRKNKPLRLNHKLEEILHWTFRAPVVLGGVEIVVVVVVVSHIQRIGCQPEKTTLHGGQSRSWSAEQGKENKRKSLAAYPPPPTPHTARSEKINKITRRIYRRYAGGRSRVRTRIPSARRLGLWVWLRKILHSRLR